MAAAEPMGLAEPGQRGTLDLTDKAVTKITRVAVQGVSGVAPASDASGVVTGALGRDLPRIDVARAGRQVDVQVELASVWPHSAARVADGVRAAVSAQLASLADLHTGAVNIAVVKVVRSSRDQGQLGRVQ